jgi:hypothetical protein
MDILLIIILIILVIVILFLSLALFLFSKKGIFFSKKEKEYIVFVIDMFTQYGDDLGIQSKEQHLKLTEELEKIKNKHLK